jgi:hypothetical protein
VWSFVSCVSVPSRSKKSRQSPTCAATSVLPTIALAVRVVAMPRSSGTVMLFW